MGDYVDLGRQSCSSCKLSEVKRRLTYLCMKGLAIGLIGSSLFLFSWLKVFYLPSYSLGDVAQEAVVSPVDLEMSLDVRTVLGDELPESFGKAYSLAFREGSSSENSSTVKGDWEERGRDEIGSISTLPRDEVEVVLRSAREFLNAVHFVDLSTHWCLEELQPSSVQNTSPLIFPVKMSVDSEVFVSECLGKLRHHLEEKGFPELAIKEALSRLEKKQLDIVLDKETSTFFKNELSTAKRVAKVPKGAVLVAKYQRIGPKELKKIRFLKSNLDRTSTILTQRRIVESFLFSLIVLFIGFLALRFLRTELFVATDKFILYALIISFSLFVTKLVEIFFASGALHLNDWATYPLLVPFTSILIARLVGVPIAGITGVLLSIIYTLGSDIWNSSTFLGVNLLCTLYATVIMEKSQRLSAIFGVGIRLWVVSINVLSAVRLFLGNWSVEAFYVDCFSSLVYCFVTVVAAVGLIPILENYFGASSNDYLLALLDSECPLLKRLFEEAPGTYQHSVLVGSLAEAAANAIGADGLFCRVAAQYHDVGKLVYPEFFIENRSTIKTGAAFPVDPVETARLIISHVPEGIELAKKAGLPESFVRIIEEHHGTSLLRSVYYEYVQSRSLVDKVDEELFRYQGKKPSTKESTILMIVDSVEAASRSLDEINESSVSELTGKIIAQKLFDGQFSCSPVNLEELAIIHSVIVKMLCSALHSRNKYPEATILADDRSRRGLIA
ncbi:HDIG domain-containing metalloprotein [Chlamydiifrater phoenicopteri]|uniref:HDIG domain-containing metalloprotein n=1 Tax=Chlamydiifrater phoenicopteri TaxID=2681469 RepID=UPI001BD0D82D|nr:HDIG domain-containing metalloprotein [Chlamydiifrater phoenicopteri]